jgi:hypothetical protein
VNYTTIEDVPKGEHILANTFSLNGHPIVILFDLGTSHDFISMACTQKCQLVIEQMSTPYMILTPGGNVVTKQLVINASLSIGGRVYKTHLIVLDGQGIDVILGMSWMRDHKALLDTTSCTMRLDSPHHGVVVLQLPSPSRTTPSLHHTTTQKQEDICVACEFLDVFPEDLPSMPLDWDVESTIRLQCSTAPISRRPCKMTRKELVELKIQLKELLDKGYILLSSSPWSCPSLFVKKKDQSLRLCVDYRPLNAVTVNNKYPLPHVDIHFDQLAGPKVISKVYLHLGYHQIKIHLEDIPKTAFSTLYGLYEYLVMSFGLTNAPTHFIYLMNFVFMLELDKFAMIFIVNILISSKSEEEHPQHL